MPHAEGDTLTHADAAPPHAQHTEAAAGTATCVGATSAGPPVADLDGDWEMLLAAHAAPAQTQQAQHAPLSSTTAAGAPIPPLRAPPAGLPLLSSMSAMGMRVKKTRVVVEGKGAKRKAEGGVCVGWGGWVGWVGWVGGVGGSF